MIWSILFTGLAFFAPLFLSAPFGQPEDAKQEKTVVVEMTTQCDSKNAADANTPVVKTEALTLVMGDDPEEGTIYIDSDGTAASGEGEVVKRVVIKSDDGKTEHGVTAGCEKTAKVIVSGGEGATIILNSEKGKDGAKTKNVFRIENIETLKDLKDGETRTLGEGEHAVVATRQGEKIVLKLKDGKEICFLPMSGKVDAHGKGHYVTACKTAKTDEHALYLVKAKGDDSKNKEFDLCMHSDNAKLKLMIDSETFDITTSDLVEGTPKTYTVGSSTLTMTRTGDKVHVKVEKTPIIP